MKPLYNLLKNNVEFKGSKSGENAFERVKKLCQSFNSLWSRYTIKLVCSDSEYGIEQFCCLLCQIIVNDPSIVFISRTLNETERAVSKLYEYLAGGKYEIASGYVIRGYFWGVSKVRLG